MAPLERGAQRLLPCGGVPRTAAKRVQGSSEAGVELLGAEHGHACCGELDRERQPVEAAAHTCDRPGVGRRQLEARIPAVRALHEQGAGGGLFDRFGSTVLRDLERAHGVALLRLELQRFAAGRQHAQAWTAGQEIADERSCLEHMLEVVQHEDSPLRAEEALDSGNRRFAAHRSHVERLRDRTRDVLTLCDGREEDQPGTVRILGLEPPCHVEGQPRLAHPARPGERHEAVVLPVKQVRDRATVLVATDGGALAAPGAG